MSIEVGHSTFPVFVSKPDQYGTSFEEIEGLKDEVQQTDAGFTELVSALDTVLEHAGMHGEIVRAMHDEGKYLIGISAERGFHDNKASVGGLLYAETEGQKDLGFSVLRMGTWMSRSRLREGTQEELRNQLLDMSLADVRNKKSRFVPVPVNRLTRVIPLHPLLEGESAEGYIYGHRLEEAEVAKLDVPERLGNLLSFVTRAWHRSELVNGDEGSFADVQDELHDRWF